MAFNKIISTGQEGTEIGALSGAFLAGFQTGGYIPKNYKTIDGERPELAVFGLVELETDKFKEAVEKCISDADAILCFESEKRSTIENNINALIINSKKPVLRASISNMPNTLEIERFFATHKINVLYVTGKIEKGEYKTIYKMISKYIEGMIKEMEFWGKFAANKY